MMLPSGNDAASALAETFGQFMYQQSKEYQDLVRSSQSNSIQILVAKALNIFVQEMNNQAQVLKLSDTIYANPHGLENIVNQSTAFDQALLSYIICQNKLIQKIISSKFYVCSLHNANNNS